MQLPPMLVQSDGRFDFGGVPPGAYTLEVMATPGMATGGPSGMAMSFVGARGGPPPPPPPPPPPGRGGAAPPRDILWASETISVGDDDVIGLVVAIQRGLTISGKIEFAGTAALPALNTGRGIVQLVPMELRPASTPPFQAQLRPDFTFTFIVPPGRYVLPFVPTFSPAWTNVKSMTAKGADIFDVPLVVDGDIPNVVLTLTDTPVPQLMGTADLPAGEIPEEWSVLIFPADRRFWKEPFGAIRRFVTARLTPQRTFTPRLPPGDYLLSLHRGPIPEWMEATTLEELAKGATSVTVVEGDKKVVQVKR
jgi:hypothetical protein